MVADPHWTVCLAHWVVGVAIALAVGKLGIVGGILLTFKHSLPVATATELALEQIGGLAFVFGPMGRTSGVVSDDVYALIVSVTIVSFIGSAISVPFTPRIGDLVARFLKVCASG